MNWFRLEDVDAGSPQAACRLALELKRCATLSDVAQMAAFVSSDSSTRIQDVAKRMLDQTESDAVACAGVPAALTQKAFHYQKIAFDGGDPRMQRWLAQSSALHLSIC